MAHSGNEYINLTADAAKFAEAKTKREKVRIMRKFVNGFKK